MKKIAIMVAGILMAFNIFAAEEAGKESKEKVEETKAEAAVTETAKKDSGWDFSGTNVEYVHTFLDSDKKTNYSGKDVDLILKVKKTIDENTWISAKYDTDDSDPDTKIEILANRKIGKYLEAQIDLDLITDSTTKDETTGKEVKVGGIQLTEDNDSAKSFIKYKATDKLTLKFAPFNIDFGMGTELATDDQPEIPGVQADYVMSDKMSVYAGIGSRSIEKKTEEKTAYGLKAGFGYNPSEDFTLTGAFSTANLPDEDVDSKKVFVANTAANLTMNYKVGKIGVDAEFAYVALNKAKLLKGEDTTVTADDKYYPDKSGTGLYGKLSYDLGNTMKDVGTVPYVSLKNYSEYFYFDDDDSYQNYSKSHGGLTIAALGVDLTTSRGLTITPEVEFRSAKNKIYNGEKDKTATYLTTTVELEF